MLETWCPAARVVPKQSAPPMSYQTVDIHIFVRCCGSVAESWCLV
jgi:hypothetical protein